MKYRNFAKYVSIGIFSTSVGWVYYQIVRTRDILNNLLDTSVLISMDDNADHDEQNSKKFLLLNNLIKNTNFFYRSWLSIKFKYAQRLLALTDSENKTIRLKAIKQLAQLRNLDNWQYSVLSSSISPQTAVALARTEGCDKRLFMEPPLRYLTYNRAMLTAAMKDLLLEMYNKTKHSCMGYFISKVFEDDLISHEVGPSHYETLNKLAQTQDDLFPLCLETILHHCCVRDYAKDLVELKGLPLLLEIHKRFQRDIGTNIILSRIICLLSSYPEFLEPLYQSGWIGILAKWMDHPDIRISVPAIRALANLDRDESANYNRYLYLLHPATRSTQGNELLDVVFVHGLLGGVFFTWRQRNGREKGHMYRRSIDKKEHYSEAEIELINRRKQNKRLKFVSSDRHVQEYLETIAELTSDPLLNDYEIVFNDLPIKADTSCEHSDICSVSGDQLEEENLCDLYDCPTYCWPKDWLAEDCNRLRIIGINYDTSLSMWSPICPEGKVKFTLEEKAAELTEKLKQAKVGNRPIVWVTHSMGGLIVKEILTKAFESEDEGNKKLCNRTRGIIFLSTPHKGSRLANLSNTTALILWPSVEVQELRENSEKLLQIHDKFINIVKNMPIKIVTLVETKDTVFTALKFNFLLVEPNSGRTGIGEYYEVPLDHLGICKPTNRYSFIYQKILQVITGILQEEQDKKF